MRLGAWAAIRVLKTRGVSPTTESQKKKTLKKEEFRHYLFNWDCATASNAICSALQDLLLFVWVTPFPRLQSKKESLCSIKCSSSHRGCFLKKKKFFFKAIKKIFLHINTESTGED